MKLAGKHIAKRKAVLHSLFWLTWIVSFTILQSLGFGLDRYFVWLLYYVITLPVFVIHTYLIAYWLIPNTFMKGKYSLLLPGLLLFLLLFSVIELVISNELVFKLFEPELAFGTGYLNIKNIVISGIGNHYIILVFLAIKVGRTWQNAQIRKDEIHQQKIETETEIYRYQLQPKIMLNLMEELGVITRNNPGKSPDMIIRISNFLNQLLQESREDIISLGDEVELIRHFFEIHKQALGNRLAIHFVIDGNTKSFYMPPLLMLSVVNNAIKCAYRCNNSFESSVIIKAEKKYLLITFALWSQEKFELDDFDVIAITKKRLEFRFPGKYRLIESTDDNFREISLEIFF